MSADTMDIQGILDEQLFDELVRRARSRSIPAETTKALLQTMPKNAVIAEANLRIGVQVLRAPEEVNVNALNEAAARFARRDYAETLWNLERALGRKFIGLGDLVLGAR